MSDDQNLSLARNSKIGLFHLGSGMADVIVAGIWNRVMISDLGFSAAPISILLALRYFLTPLGIWAGQISDRRTVLGYRRLFWIWLGRALMALSIFALGTTTADLARGHEATPLTWGIIIGALLLFSLGNGLSGGVFLALIYDRAPERQRGRAVGLVWAFLLTGFAFAGFFFGVLLPASTTDTAGTHVLSFSPDRLQILFIVGALVLGALWFFSVLGEERRSKTRVEFETVAESHSTFRADLKLVWNNRVTRLFFWFLALSFIFVFAQDAILEPFGGDVFGIDASHTTRFAAYWGSMAIISTLLFLWLPRRYKSLTHTRMAYIGIVVVALSYALFAVAGLMGKSGRPMVTPGLIVQGIGLGIWNVGTLGMMMELSPAGRAGTFLGFWTMIETISRGIAVGSGGVLRDFVLSLSGNLQMAYVSVFAVEVVGLVVSLWILNRVNVPAFLESLPQQQSPDAASILAGAMD